MKWQGAFSIPGRPEDVIGYFADLPRMASCMPGASVESVEADGSFTGAMLVAFGPKKLIFKGKGHARTDVANLSGSLQGQGAADLRAARFKVHVTYTLSADAGAPPGEPRTSVALCSIAELQGALADFANMGGPIVADALMKQFAANAQAEFGLRHAAGTSPVTEPLRGRENSTNALSVWMLCRAILVSLVQRIRGPREQS